MADKSHHELRAIFRDLLAGDRCLNAASVFDPLSVRMAADLGFSVGILGGSVASLQVLGAPDIALITLDEFAEQANRLGRASQIPVIADADHGYGNALNAMRTVNELEKAGVAALTLEDTHLPRPFGEQPPALISADEAAAKIRAALKARSDAALSIIARSNAGATTLDDSIQRTTAYQAAGADAICLVGVQDFDHLQALTGHLTVPLMLITYGNPALADAERLSAAGVRVVVNGHAPFMAAIQAAYDTLRKESGTDSAALPLGQLLSRYTLADTHSDWMTDYLTPGTAPR